MTRCARYCLYNSIRAVNLIMLLCGIGMIIYSLWLEKRWDESIAKLPHGPSSLKPWFIWTFLCLGIVVCLSTVGGHIFANCISTSTLCVYVVSICCLLFIEVAVVVAIFFRMDWGKKITAYTGMDRTEFESFVLMHVSITRAITLLILIGQIIVAMLAVLLWAVGAAEPRVHFDELDIPVFSDSFLVPSTAGLAESSRHVCTRCGTLLLQGNATRRSFLSHLKNVLRPFQRRNTVN